MKQFIILISGAIFLLLFVFFFSPNFSRLYHHMLTKNTNLSQEQIDGLHLNDTINCKGLEKSRDVEEYDYYELRKGIEVATRKSEVNIVRFIVTDSEQETVRGIKIGDEKEKVIKEYGENYYTRLEQGVDIIGYVDKKKQTSIEFWLADGKVDMYRYDYQFME